MSGDFDVEIRTNPKGFRDDAYELEKSGGKKRVVGLGDSFTWGYGVEKDESYLEVAESRLENVEILNMGHNAYGSGQELLYLKKFGKLYAPDMVTVGFYINDLNENISGKRSQFEVLNDELVVDNSNNDNGLDDRIKAF